MLNHLTRARRFYSWLSGLPEHARAVELAAKADYKHPKVLTGTLLARMNQSAQPQDLVDVEFQVFSQFGDDGILQFLVHALDVQDRTFIEFGVENYTESNTRFLLAKDKWRGLVIDGGAANVDFINSDWATWMFDLRATCAFITAETIETLIAEAGMSGAIGILSIDIDGVDYWIWNAIRRVDPAILVIEYNAAFGAERAITVPYSPDFTRTAAHPSRLYWGASIEALKHLGASKGMTFIGCNGNGNNAYFVREALADAPQLASWRSAPASPYEDWSGPPPPDRPAPS